MSIKIAAKGERIDVECTTCGTGADIPARFGVISGDALVAAFVDQHKKPGKFCKPRPVPRLPREGEE